MRKQALILVALAAAILVPPAMAEDGYELWLRYDAPEAGIPYLPADVVTGCTAPSETIRKSLDELDIAFTSLAGEKLPQSRTAGQGSLILASADCLSSLPQSLQPDVTGLGEDGYAIRGVSSGGGKAILIAGESDVGLLYGVFDFLMRLSRGEDVRGLSVEQTPAVKLRLLNHWDNLDRHVERGYAGQSIWNWHLLPGRVDPRYEDYAHANASIGINGVSLTNVNADATVLTPQYLEKVTALADVFRPYGIKVYLTARFSAPMELGGLATADPLDEDVHEWWQAKADEIYAEIPDFGGFLVKANSEGQPGPQDYGRSHAEGANMLADALAPHGGVVMWRAFVYSAEEPEDRVKQAYTEFKPLDGQFRDNVIVQVKNGPLDFQPREPFHPLFGAMEETPLALELQITKEYLGFSTHLAYLGTLWKEVLSADTYAAGPGSTVAKVVDGELTNEALTAMAGVSNVGVDRNWTGSHFDQANWYAFGRLAWDPDASANAIARDWAALTFTTDPDVLDTIVAMMMQSREAVVNYMTPLGLTHLMGTGHHYGPALWVDDLDRADWTPYYYHRATEDAIGFDRTETGSNAVAQYAEPLREKWADVATTPDELLLWFHRLPWDYEMTSGRSLWEELVRHYDLGVQQAEDLAEQWQGLEGQIDPDRFAHVADYLEIQKQEARWWRDASIAYWQSVNGLALPEGAAPPTHNLDYYKSLEFPNAPGQGD
ncbi:alpha-glucuronidase family glycosyl hydrolase [Henriciella sp.]|uniref:alpha-glucuronidase family glycosyl hydrolase n=1 Tax=Henriciella sp. TaxID=1968823 RepID=UPI00262614B6|nr:alpha-glucuronidase family glycosyl hydrolase [Henriciella sp.]